MGLPAGIQPFLLKLVDQIYARIPRVHPGREKLSRSKIISHRGDYDNRTVFENTMAAFDRARDAGCWGIEFDVRWTKDLCPVVFHDAGLNRLFGQASNVCDLTLADLRPSFGMIPTLKEVIDAYGKRLHLMVEIKKEIYSDPVYQNKVLQDLFSALDPGGDFHFLSLSPELFKMIDFVSPDAFLPIAELNVSHISEWSIRENYGGVLGHYLMLTKPVLEKHRNHHQKVGTGFVDSKRCLFRELNRGVDWIFSDNAAEIQAICDDH